MEICQNNKQLTTMVDFVVRWKAENYQKKNAISKSSSTNIQSWFRWFNGDRDSCNTKFVSAQKECPPNTVDDVIVHIDL